ncbi:MAG: hypothetical protein ACT4PT_10065, partial [Methanobacteriota archaeon]
RRHARGDRMMPGRALEEILDARAASVFRRNLRPEALPRFVPGEPAGLAAAETAAAIAPRILDGLAEIYGIREWDEATFLTFYVGRALPAWRGLLDVDIDDGRLRVAGPYCPLAPAARGDPRVCHMCRLVHEAAARIAAPGVFTEIRWDRLVPRGDVECAMVVRRKEVPA